MIKDTLYKIVPIKELSGPNMFAIVLHDQVVGLHAVKVTPADFSDEEIKNEHNKRFPLKLFGGAFGSSKLHPRKEKTLADFSDDELAKELTKRAVKGGGKAIDIMAGMYSYGAGFEAGKRDAEPWISVEEQLPTDYTEVLGYKKTLTHGDVDIGISIVQVPRLEHLIKKHITHWKPLPEPPKQEEQKPEYKCNHCGKKLNLRGEYCSIECRKAEESASWQSSQSEYKCAQCGNKMGAVLYARIDKKENFCSSECLENSQWIDAELPRDFNKPCRYWNEEDLCWDESTLIGYGKVSFYKHKMFVTEKGWTEKCQVRKDSMEKQ